MIDPKELRIGNKVQVFPDGYIAVTEILSSGINSDEDELSGAKYPFGYLTPIPLTEEILSRVSFYIGNEHYQSQTGERKLGRFYSLQIGNKMFLQIIYMDEVECSITNREWEISSAFIRAAPLYVHQLQNLYYALTGEELKIEL